MKTILSASQFRKAEERHIFETKCTDLDLMESAARAFCGCFSSIIPDVETPIVLLCGTGNNGGDGLATAYHLYQSGYHRIRVMLLRLSDRPTQGYVENLERIKSISIRVEHADDVNALMNISEPVVIDAILGAGLNRPIQGLLKAQIAVLNDLGKRVFSVDIPSGLDETGDGIRENVVLRTDHVISFERPKLAFYFPETSEHMKEFHTVSIGMCPAAFEGLPSDIFYMEREDVETLLRPRGKFSHKGDYGHALIIAGGTGKIGAGLLCAEACLYSGAGRTSLSLGVSDSSLFCRLPEVMSISTEQLNRSLDDFTAVGVGPGMGERVNSIMKSLPLDNIVSVLDADALTFLAGNKDELLRLRENTILTPHMKEFDRLFGISKTWPARVDKARTMAVKYRLIIVLKNHYTFIAFPDGKLYINTSGNPAMASGGMGDALTGILVSLLAQGYSAKEAAILGVYLHGRSGDILARKGMRVIPATKLIHNLPFTLSEFN